MKSCQLQNARQRRVGFTLIELLVAMTIIGILVAMLTVGVQRALIRAKEFAIQQEMSQLGAAIEKFQIENGFYPPSFKGMDLARFQTYLNRMAPNNIEGSIDPMNPGMRRIDTWWNEVGLPLRTSANSDPVTQPQNSPGADLVFWLSGVAKNKQLPLTLPGGGAIAGHNYTPGGDGIERQVHFDFDSSRIILNPTNNLIASYVQPSGRQVAYLYRDAGINYLPSMPSNMNSADGAYLNAKFTDLTGEVRPVTVDDVADAAFHLGGPSTGVTAADSQKIFKLIYPNPDTFQLISFGLDGKPGGPANMIADPNPNPNVITKAGATGADNMVNFGSGGPGRLDNLILNEE